MALDPAVLLPAAVALHHDRTIMLLAIHYAAVLLQQLRWAIGAASAVWLVVVFCLSLVTCAAKGYN